VINERKEKKSADGFWKASVKRGRKRKKKKERADSPEEKKDR